MHYNCSKERCYYGIRHKSQWIVTGAVLQIWDSIKLAKQMKIIRLSATDKSGDENRLVGIHIPSQADGVRLKLALENPTPQAVVLPGSSGG